MLATDEFWEFLISANLKPCMTNLVLLLAGVRGETGEGAEGLYHSPRLPCSVSQCACEGRVSVWYFNHVVIVEQAGLTHRGLSFDSLAFYSFQHFTPNSDL